ncbi:MAG TPA: glycosyltransferase family 39 protein [Anaerolineae bacterium]|nr:glycosyltransferase family 39 protein [Anaerolineae bacterium]
MTNQTKILSKSYRLPQWSVLVAVVLFLMGLIHLESTPPLWWDEGWTLCVARHWVELGHYGCLLAGQPAPATLSAHFPVVTSIALSFRLFGVGIWQARIVGLLFTTAALLLLYHLTDRLYNRPIAIATLVMVLLLPAKWQIHPLFIGRQVLGEMPALFFLLAGYACFLRAPRKPWLFMPLTLCFWGVALMTKLQVGPFWAVSLAVPLVIAALKRQWRLAGLLTASGLGSWVVYQLLRGVQQFLLSGHTLPGSPISGLNEALSLVPVMSVRLAALRFVLIFGLPAVLGLAYAAWQWFRAQPKPQLDELQLVRLMLLSLAGSWLAWFTFLSVGWDRYAFPALFLASPFVAALLYDLTGGFKLRSGLEMALSCFKTRRFCRPPLKVVGAAFLLGLMLLLAVRSLYLFYRSDSHILVVQVAHFLNTSTPPEALIETYDSELFFLLDRPYHYPPAQLHVELIRRAFLDPQVLAEYDPLAANPDYLVVGPFSAWVRLYEPLLTTGVYRPLQTFGPYQIYERVR